jgi:hypothetical protein
MIPCVLHCIRIRYAMLCVILAIFICDRSPARGIFSPKKGMLTGVRCPRQLNPIRRGMHGSPHSDSISCSGSPKASSVSSPTCAASGTTSLNLDKCAVEDVSAILTPDLLVAEQTLRTSVVRQLFYNKRLFSLFFILVSLENYKRATR